MLRSRKRYRLLAVLLAFVMSATACGSDDTTNDAGADEGTTPQDSSPVPGDGETCTDERTGGTLTMSNYQELQTLDPYTAGGDTAESGGSILRAIYDTLVRFDPNTGEYSGHLAETIEPNDDYTQWTITLQDGITFGNGDPFDAEAVKASMDRHLDPDGSSRFSTLNTIIDDVSVESDAVVVFTLAEAWAGFPAILSTGIGMVQNVSLIDEVGEATFATDPSGGGVGPYDVKTFAPPEEIVLTAKDDYWGGMVCIEEIHYTIISNSDTAYDAFLRGETDAMVLGRDPAKLAEVRDDADSENFETYSQLQLGGSLVLPNAAEGSPTADVRVRQAVAAAIDPSVINERAFGGTGLGTKALVPENSQLFTPTDGPEIDTEKAQSLVEEVKADTDWDGSIRLFGGNAPQANVEATIAIGAMLDAAGFETEVDTTLSVTDLRTRMRDRDFDLATWGISASEENLWANMKQYRTDDPANLGSFSAPAMDQILEDLRLAATVEEQDEIVTEMQDVLNETVPFVPFAAFEPALLWHENVHGLTFGSTMNHFFEQAYVDN